MKPTMLIRPGRDSDGPSLIALIWSCWSLYPGVLMDVDAEMPEMHALATYYAKQGGALWMAEGARGMIATRPAGESVWEICRLYVSPHLHGSGLGQTLMQVAEAYAVAAAASRLILYSDTRFSRAHRFYEKLGYLPTGETRPLHDISRSWEYAFAKPVA